MTFCRFVVCALSELFLPWGPGHTVKHMFVLSPCNLKALGRRGCQHISYYVITAACMAIESLYELTLYLFTGTTTDGCPHSQWIGLEHADPGPRGCVQNILLHPWDTSLHLQKIFPGWGELDPGVMQLGRPCQMTPGLDPEEAWWMGHPHCWSVKGALGIARWRDPPSPRHCWALRSLKREQSSR